MSQEEKNWFEKTFTPTARDQSEDPGLLELLTFGAIKPDPKPPEPNTFAEVFDRFTSGESVPVGDFFAPIGTFTNNLFDPITRGLYNLTKGPSQEAAEAAGNLGNTLLSNVDTAVAGATGVNNSGTTVTNTSGIRNYTPLTNQQRLEMFGPSIGYTDPSMQFDQQYYLSLLKTDPAAAKAYENSWKGTTGTVLTEVEDIVEEVVDKNTGEKVRFVVGQIYVKDGIQYEVVSVDEDGNPTALKRILSSFRTGLNNGNTTEAGFRTGESPFKAGQTYTFDGVDYIWDGNQFTPKSQERGTQEVAGADANMPTDKYLETLGTNTLAGEAYANALARQMAAIQNQRTSIGQTYSDIYEQAKMAQARRRGLSDVTGFTGGMEEQMGARMSAAEMAALGQIGMGREQAIRDLEAQQLAAPSNAFLEAQQMLEFEQNQSPQARRLDILRQYGEATGDYSQYFDLANQIYGTDVSFTPQDDEDKQLVDEDGKTIYGVFDDSKGVDLKDLQGTDTIGRTTAISNEIANLKLDDQAIQQSQFKDSVVSDASSLSQLVLQLGSANAANNPNYNYRYEINLVNRAIKDVTSLTKEEISKLSPFVNETVGSFNPPLVKGGGGSGIFNQLGFPKTEATDAFVNKLIQDGRISQTDYKIENNINPRNAQVLSGSIRTMQQYDQFYFINDAIDSATLKQEYINFLDSYNQKYKVGA